MASTLVLAAVVFGASLVLLMGHFRDGLRIVLTVAAGILLLLASGVLRVDLRGIPIREVLFCVVAVCGCTLYMRSSAKTQIAAATCVALIGILSVLSMFHLLR